MASRKRKRKAPPKNVGIIRDSSASNFSSESMKSYGSYVNMNRAVADVRDGLKPVQRRILWSMHELKMNKGFKKSAKIVGDCLAKGTLVRTHKGLLPIEEVVGGTGLSTLDLPSTTINNLDKGSNRVTRVTLRRGYSLCGTSDHRVLTLDSNLDLTWVNIGDLRVGSSLVLKGAIPVSEYPQNEVTLKWEKTRGFIDMVPPSTCTKSMAYLLGLLVSEGSIGSTKRGSKLTFGTTDPRLNDLFAESWESCFGENIPVSGWRVCPLGGPSRRKKVLHEYINGRYSVLDFFGYLGFKGTAAYKRVPWVILQSPRSHIIEFIAAYWDGDGCVSDNKAVAVSASLELLREIQVLLLELGIQSQIGKFIHEHGAYNLNVHTADLPLFLSIIGVRTERFNCIVLNKKRHSHPLIDLVPHARSLYHNACTLAHRGGGWFRCHDGTTRRLNTGSKIYHRYLRDGLYVKFIQETALPVLAQIDPVLHGKFKSVVDSKVRFLPVESLTDEGTQQVFDINVEDVHNFVANGMVVHNCMGNFHPHGDNSIYQTMVNMTWDRYPLVEGHGNFGGPIDNAAAARYTEARLSPLAAYLFEDSAVAKMVPNYSGDRTEPLVLPSRLPLLLLNGSSGIGVGLKASIPPHNLKELIKCLVYFIKKDEPRLSSVVRHMPGPDYGHGVLLSSAKEVEDLYKTGRGSLKYRCMYSLTTDRGTPVLTVDSEAPNFSLANFLKKMRALSEDGLIEFCSDSSSSEGVKVYVGYKDPIVLRDRVIPELYTSQSYQFFVVNKEEEDTELSKESLFSGGLFTMFDSFVTFRRKVEEARLLRNKGLTKKKLSKLNAVLSAINNLSKVYEVLQGDHDTLGAMRTSLSSSLGITEDQAQHVLDMQVHRLARLNKDSLLSDVKEQEETLVQIDTDLSDIDVVIIRHLKELLKFKDERGTKLAEDAPAPKLKIQDTSTWVTSKDKKITRSTSTPRKGSKFDFVSEVRAAVTVVCSNNNAQVLPSSYITEHVTDQDVVGLISDACPYVAALNVQGKVVVFNRPSHKKKFNVIKDTISLTSASGIPPNGDLLLLRDGEGVRVRHNKIKSTRPFVIGSKLSSFIPSSLMGVSNDYTLVDSTGSHMKFSRNGSFKFSGTLHAVSDSNFAVVKGKASLATHEQVLDLIRSGALEKCWPIL